MLLLLITDYCLILAVYTSAARSEKDSTYLTTLQGILKVGLFKIVLPTPPRTWLRPTGGQLKTWTTTLKADMVFLCGSSAAHPRFDGPVHPVPSPSGAAAEAPGLLSVFSSLSPRTRQGEQKEVSDQLTLSTSRSVAKSLMPLKILQL